ncbi:MAG TPA: hypothetical protein VK797_23470 [Tepidisphaeraceae bacterium]|jgi:hypothetical protein|nr:hypothetical protein [Tepidisphaeraceae bacterium]
MADRDKADGDRPTDRKRLPIREAARLVGRDYRYLRKLALELQVRSYRRGGTARRPWLEFYLDELRADLDKAEQFKRVAASVPPRKPRVSSVSSALHPAAAAM